MPQNWTSDDTDPVERLKIQHGTSLVYPSSLMTAHVSASPNHQTGRITSMRFRGDVAMAENFGYELNLTQLSQEDKDEIARQVSLYKELRMLVQYGDLYRTSSPFDSNLTAWVYVSQDKTQAAVFCYQVPHWGQSAGASLSYFRTGSQRGLSDRGDRSGDFRTAADGIWPSSASPDESRRFHQPALETEKNIT